MYKITDENLLYSTGNSTQYSMMAQMERKSKRGEIYIYTHTHTYIYVNI